MDVTKVVEQYPHRSLTESIIGAAAASSRWYQAQNPLTRFFLCDFLCPLW